MKHEFPKEVLDVAKKLGITDDELDAIYPHLLDALIKDLVLASKHIAWFPSDLPPKDETIVLGEDAEGCSYIVKYIDGSARECRNIMECEHSDHSEITDGKCREMKEGFYEILEQFKGDYKYYMKRREIVIWRATPKSS